MIFRILRGGNGCVTGALQATRRGWLPPEEQDYSLGLRLIIRRQV